MNRAWPTAARLIKQFSLKSGQTQDASTPIWLKACSEGILLVSSWASIHEDSSWNKNCFENWRKKLQYFMCQQVVYSNVLILWIYVNLVVPTVHLKLFFSQNYRNGENFHGVWKVKYSKISHNPEEASLKCLNGPEQESWTGNGKLGLCDYEIPKKMHDLLTIAEIVMGEGEISFLVSENNPQLSGFWDSLVQKASAVII